MQLEALHATGSVEERLGLKTHKLRKQREKILKTRLSSDSFIDRVIDKMVSSDFIMKCITWPTGIAFLGGLEARNIVVEKHEISHAMIPEAFDGFKILHLSDHHFACMKGQVDNIAKVIDGLEYDLVLITGDYMHKYYEPVSLALDELEKLYPLLKAPALTILGNHDSLDIVEGMETIGYKVLLNEAWKVSKGDASIFVAGVDDPYYFESDDIAAASDNIPKDTFSILLTHSPENYIEAEHQGFDFLLAGHTHGGQFCLPGGYAPLHHGRCPRSMNKGLWRYGELTGYTSRGCGTVSIAARLNCKPEVAVHCLTK